MSTSIIAGYGLSLSGILGISATGAAIYIFFLVIYRLFFHPLSRYPGPWAAKVTDLYQMYYAWKQTRHTKIKDLHEQYGPYVRYGPNILLAQSDEALKAIYGAKANTGKSDYYKIMHIKGSTHVVSSIDKSEHARKRRTLAHAFSEQALRGMNKHVLAHIDQLCRMLPSEDDPTRWGPPRNMSNLLLCMTFDVICDLAYGKDNMGMLETPENRWILHALCSATYRGNMFGVMLSWANMGLDMLCFPNLFRNQAKFQKFSKSMAEERVKLGNDADRRDFFYHLINAKDPVTGTGLSENEFWVESNLLIIAGTDTTAIALSSAYFYLTLYPEVLKRLEEEILGKFNSLEEISVGPALSGCQYLRAVIDESMRLSPSVPGFVPRKALEGGVFIEDKYIPQGVELGTGIWSIHHDAKYYPNPLVFLPERWIISPTNPEEKVKLAQSAFNPFSLGARGCLGKNLAYIELQTTLARSIWLYEMRRMPGSTVGADASGIQFMQKDTFTSFTDGPLVQFKLRKREWKVASMESQRVQLVL